MWRKVRWRVTTVYSALLHILKTRSYFIVSTYATTQRPVLLLFQQSSEIWIVYSYFGPFQLNLTFKIFLHESLENLLRRLSNSSLSTKTEFQNCYLNGYGYQQSGFISYYL